MYSPLPYHLRTILKRLHFEIMTLALAGQSNRLGGLLDVYSRVLDLASFVEEGDREDMTDVLPMHVRDWHAAGIAVPENCRRYVGTREGWYNGEDGFRSGIWGIKGPSDRS